MSSYIVPVFFNNILEGVDGVPYIYRTWIFFRPPDMVSERNSKVNTLM